MGFFDENLTDLTKRVFEIERNFWNDHTQPFYLVSVIPTGPPNDVGNVGGTALENAFAMFLAPRTQLKDIRYLLTHEYFHHWNPMKLGRLKSPEQLLYWWSEGVSDFYTHRLMLRGGLTTLTEYARGYNDVLKTYTNSTVRNASNLQIEKDFLEKSGSGQVALSARYAICTSARFGDT